MWKARYVAMAAAISVLLIIGCSGAGGINTVAPSQEPTKPALENESESQRVLWGLWDIRFDTSELKAAVIPVRNPQKHFNITDMITPPQCYDCLEINVNSFNPVTRILDVDVTLRNQFGIPGYDVRGILHTNDYGHLLTNFDDWTGLWDVPGGMDINPFKAFAKGEPNRVFEAYAQHTEKYLIHIPKPPAWYGITFAADASWPGNCKEPYEIEDFAQQEIDETAGSEGLVQVTVHDWQDDVDVVQLSVPEVTTQQFVWLSPVGGDVWQINLVNFAGAAEGEYAAMVKATSTSSSDHVLYDYFTLTIGKQKGWARTWGGENADYAYSVATDDSGNIYITGDFYFTTVDFDPGPGTDEHISNGSTDAALAKFLPDGYW